MLVDVFTLMPMFVSLLWAFVLLSTSKYNKAKKVLGFFMLATFMLFVTHFVYYNNLKEHYLVFDILFVFCSLIIYPLYYLYIKVLTKSPAIHRTDYLLFLPAVLQVTLVTLVYALMEKDIRTSYIEQFLFSRGQFHSAPPLLKLQILLTYVLQAVYFIQIVFSSFKIKKYVNNYNSNIENYYSDINEKTVEWHKLILYSFLIISILSIFYNFLGRAFFSNSVWVLAFPSVTYTVLLFLFGYLGNLQNYNVSDFDKEKSDNKVHHSTSESAMPLNELTIAQKLIVDIEKVVETEKLYIKPDLKITELAERLNTNRTYISNAINTNCSCTFNAFINKFRVEQAKKLLSNPEYNLFSLEHIASLSGFAHLHTFIRVFKETEDTTPGKYRNYSQNAGQEVS